MTAFSSPACIHGEGAGREGLIWAIVGLRVGADLLYSYPMCL